MQIQPAVFFLVLASLVGASSGQVGPDPREAPARPVAVQTQQPAPAATPPVSLDDALIAGSRPLGTPRVQPVVQDQRAADPLPPSGLVGANANAKTPSMLSRGSLAQTAIALGGVLLLIFGLGQLYKRLARSQGGLAGAMGAGGSAPSGLVEILGRYPISSKMTLVVMRFDRRVLLLSHAGGGRGKNAKMGAMTVLCELDQPEDVASVLLKVRNEEGDSIAQSFERSLREADSLQDEQLNEPQFEYERPRVRVPTRSRQPMQVMRNNEGDRAEFGTPTQAEAAAGVMRRRLAAMRPGHQAQQIQNLYGGTSR